MTECCHITECTQKVSKINYETICSGGSEPKFELDDCFYSNDLDEDELNEILKLPRLWKEAVEG